MGRRNARRNGWQSYRQAANASLAFQSCNMYHRDKILSKVEFLYLLATGMVVHGKVVVAEVF